MKRGLTCQDCGERLEVPRKIEGGRAMLKLVWLATRHRQWVGIEKLADDLAFSYQQVYHAMKDLEDAGLVKATPALTGGGKVYSDPETYEPP